MSTVDNQFSPFTFSTSMAQPPSGRPSTTTAKGNRWREFITTSGAGWSCAKAVSTSPGDLWKEPLAGKSVLLDVRPAASGAFFCFAYAAARAPSRVVGGRGETSPRSDDPTKRTPFPNRYLGPELHVEKCLDSAAGRFFFFPPRSGFRSGALSNAFRRPHGILRLHPKIRWENHRSPGHAPERRTRKTDHELIGPKGRYRMARGPPSAAVRFFPFRPGPVRFSFSSLQTNKTARPPSLRSLKAACTGSRLRMGIYLGRDYSSCGASGRYARGSPPTAVFLHIIYPPQSSEARRERQHPPGPAEVSPHLRCGVRSHAAWPPVSE